MRIVWKSIQYYFPLSIGTVCQALLSCDYEVSPSSINYDLLTNSSRFVQLTLGQSKDCTRACGIFLYDNNQIKSQLNTTTHGPCLVLGMQSNTGWRHDMGYCPQYWSPMKGIHCVTGRSHHKRQLVKTLIFSLLLTWIRCWINNRRFGTTLLLSWRQCY